MKSYDSSLKIQSVSKYTEAESTEVINCNPPPFFLNILCLLTSSCPVFSGPVRVHR